MFDGLGLIADGKGEFGATDREIFEDLERKALGLSDLGICLVTENDSGIDLDNLTPCRSYDSCTYQKKTADCLLGYGPDCRVLNPGGTR